MNLWLLHEEYHFHRLQIFSVGKNHFWRVCQNDYSITLEGYGEMITVLHRWGYAQMITILHRGEGSLETPKSDYVISARPLIGLEQSLFSVAPSPFL